MTQAKVPADKYLRYGWQTLGAYVLTYFFKMLPLETASRLGGQIMRWFGPKTGKHRKVMLPQLRAVFPDKSPAEIDAIALAAWDNMGRVISEYSHLETIWDNVELVGGEHLAAVRDSGRPVIFLSGHIANWEINPIGVSKSGIPASVVYRKPNNLWVDGLLRRARNAGAVGQIEKGASGARAIIALLRRKGTVGMVVDHRLYNGRLVPFLGFPAWTGHAVAQLGLRFDCLLLPTRIERIAGARFRMTVFPPLHLPAGGDSEENIMSVLTTINDMLSDWIKDRPDQWLWTHRRWRDAPEDPARRPGAAR